MIDLKAYRIKRMRKRIEAYDKSIAGFKNTLKKMVAQRNKQQKKLDKLLREPSLTD